jgi:hypothetical protein
MNEVWKEIKGYEGLYQVSNLGRIKSSHKEKHIIIKPGKDKDGYLQFGFSNNGTVLMRKIHRKVAETFIDNPHNKKTVNHINGIKDDNRVENLAWCTHLENMQHARRIGLIDQHGEKSVRAKLSLSEVRAIRKSYKETKLNQYELAEIYGVSQTCISEITLFKTWNEVLYVKETKEETKKIKETN